MDNNTRQEISKIIIKVLKSRFDSFLEDYNQSRNAPFHKAFLQAFSEKIEAAGSNIDAVISMSSWMHGLNTTLGETFFESVAHILCDGEKKPFKGAECKIYAEQESAISEIMTSLKNGERTPSVAEEELLIASCASGEMITGTNFTVDCYFEDEDTIVAIELKSVRPNSGETRGEKQKILKAKAALKNKYPDKVVKYYFGFPFDPTSDTDTGYDKKRFMNNMIEFPKFCDDKEILLADELWCFLSGEEGTMQELLSQIRNIATPNFMEEYSFINTPSNLLDNTEQYIEIVSRWGLIDEAKIAVSIKELKNKQNTKVKRNLRLRAFNSDSKYNENRARTLLSFC